MASTRFASARLVSHASIMTCEVPTCSTTGCGAMAPVCNITTDTCEGCGDSSSCSRFNESPVCDNAAGSNVECVVDADCKAATKAICDMHTCRGCARDTDCASDACGDDGACVPESSIVYLAVGASDSGTCTRSAPCGSVKYGVSQTTATRNHIVMAKGGYVEASINIDTTTTSANAVTVHGGGAGLIYPSGGDASMFQTNIPVTIRDLEFSIPNGTAGHALALGAGALVERVHVHDAISGISIAGPSTLRDVTIENVKQGISVQSTGALTLDRGVIRGGAVGIRAAAGGSVQIQNLLVWGTTGLALDLSSTSGSVAFATIADSGSDTGVGPRAVACANGVVVRSSIIWAPGSTSRVPLDGCSLVNVIAGPTAAAGASNMNPQFVNAANRDYHILGRVLPCELNRRSTRARRRSSRGRRA